ncbi:hypothetical protein [Methylocella sp. CPCC 101449]|uniref:hypothetical protein n=1 Tax=Methylocella sp. CPCC 101449 TaxID=2987531 RepID=UPI00288E73B6|nr:hypothetical protein [Methylocella sp. CPCC 101449]MDT2022812.1 hypothetical protein [Methylocella sp. CPCC 101449]
MTRHSPREPFDVYAGRVRVGRLEPTESGVQAYVVDDTDGGLRFVGTAPTAKEAQGLITAARAGASARSEEAIAP